jgi:hypothetical protein
MPGHTQLQMSAPDMRCLLDELAHWISYLRTQVAISPARNQSIRTLQQCVGRLLPFLDQQTTSLVFSIDEQEKTEILHALTLRTNLLKQQPISFQRDNELARLQLLGSQIRGDQTTAQHIHEGMPWKERATKTTRGIVRRVQDRR